MIFVNLYLIDGKCVSERKVSYQNLISCLLPPPVLNETIVSTCRYGEQTLKKSAVWRSGNQTAPGNAMSERIILPKALNQFYRLRP